VIEIGLKVKITKALFFIKAAVQLKRGFLE
jgi:hypothetical protein